MPVLSSASSFSMMAKKCRPLHAHQTITQHTIMITAIEPRLQVSLGRLRDGTVVYNASIEIMVFVNQ